MVVVAEDVEQNLMFLSHDKICIWKMNICSLSESNLFCFVVLSKKQKKKLKYLFKTSWMITDEDACSVWKRARLFLRNRLLVFHLVWQIGATANKKCLFKNLFNDNGFRCLLSFRLLSCSRVLVFPPCLAEWRNSNQWKTILSLRPFQISALNLTCTESSVNC